VAKYFGYSNIATQLQSILSEQVLHNAPSTNKSKSASSSSQGNQNASQSQKSSASTGANSTMQSNRAQALINLATAAENVANDYAGQGSYDRVNSLLIATALARHKADMAKLDADYQADLIIIYNAEINAVLRQVIDLNDANTALGSTVLSERGFAIPPSAPQKYVDALAAWTASQDEGEIPYQVLQAKEVQLLRAKSVKVGQISAQDYENLIKPVLAELDAYGKGGITTQTIVQALGFIGVITSTSAK
jgi:hypothetical protein